MSIKDRIGERGRRLAGWALAAMLLAGPAAAADGESVVDGVVHVESGDLPRDGVQTLAFEELWRVGGPDDEETLFGVIGQARKDDEGNVYLLDRQLSEVQVYSPDGDYLRTLSREGDGPGEVRFPRDIFLLADGTLGILQMMPGKIVKLDLDGNPAGTIMLGDPQEGRMSMLFDAAARNGRLLVVGQKFSPGEKTFKRTKYLSLIDSQGDEIVRCLEASVENRRGFFKWDEEEDYFVHLGRNALGPDGRVYAAPERDKYEIQVFSPEGVLERVIERDYVPRKRTAEEKETVSNSIRIRAGNHEVEKVVSDTDPVITQLSVDEDSNLWVLHSRSDKDQPDGVFQTYDVYDSEGHFARRVEVTCPGDPEEDGLFLIDSGSAVFVRGLVDAAQSMVGSGGGDDGEDDDGGYAAPLEVIYYRVVPVGTAAAGQNGGAGG